MSIIGSTQRAAVAMQPKIAQRFSALTGVDVMMPMSIKAQSQFFGYPNFFTRAKRSSSEQI